ncbi:MAG: diguanylate cyclase [Pseudohongiella sp.]|nr:diguanylate cyclase [Pseudohongiella sp.]
MSFNEKLHQIQQQYLQSLPSTLQQINTLAQALLTPAPGTEQLKSLSHLLHKLSGAAGTFGLPALSTKAAELDQRLEAILLARPASGSSDHERLRLKSDLDALSEFVVPADLPERPESSFNPGKNGQTLIPEIWLLEDDVALGSALLTHLQAFNFKARLFTSFADLLRAYDKAKPEVLILDVLLGNEGRSTDCMLESKFLENSSSRVIFISAKDNFQTRLQAADLRADAFFVKPLDIPKLITRLEQVLERLHAPPERVLIIDDDELLVRYYQQLLTDAGMLVHVLNQPERIKETLEHDCPDIILMDLEMPGIDGQNLAAVIRQYDHWLGLPIIYLSAEHDPQRQLLALNQGADDFLIKPVTDEHLITAVKSKVVRSRQILDLMTKDSLTGLLKHAAIKEAVRREWGLAKRKGEAFCVAMLDIDHFKQVNDRFGHAIGDEVITSVATLLRKRLRGTDVLGRYGGEEFVVVMSRCDADTAAKVLDDFRQRFQELRFSAGAEQFSATISIGIAEYRPGTNIDAEALLVNADKAMYEAKKTGRNKLVLG